MIESESVSMSTTIALNPTNAMLIATDLEDWASEINSEHIAALDCAETAVEHARRAGGLLIKAKQALSHGDWLPWVAANIQLGERHVQNYMKLARANTQRVSDLSQRRALAELAAPPTSKVDNDDTASGKSLSVETSEVKAHKGKAVQSDPPEANSSEDSTPKHEPYWNDEYVSSLESLLIGDDKLVAAHEEIKRQAAEIAVLKGSRDSYMNQSGEVVGRFKRERSKNARLEREIGRLKAENAALRKHIQILEEPA